MGRSSGSAVNSRREATVRLVLERGHVVVAELAETLGVSEMTVRRDVAVLVGDGRVVSFHGGVRATRSDGFPGTFGVRAQVEADVKRRIADRAARFVSGSASVIAIDAGSTAALLAHRLVGADGIRVVTASVPVISALADAEGVDVAVLGGTLRRETQSFVGPSVAAAAREVQVETFFLGAAGLSDRGAFDVTDLDAVVKRELIEVSGRVIALADATKFGRRALSRICGWDAIDVLVTDDRIDATSSAVVAGYGVDVVIVESAP